jgi:hypothetical protein
MREREGMGRSTKYGTCSPDLDYCPDGKCDELESIRDICPQDCTSTLFTFWFFLWNLKDGSSINHDNFISMIGRSLIGMHMTQ